MNTRKIVVTLAKLIGLTTKKEEDIFNNSQFPTAKEQEILMNVVDSFVLKYWTKLSG